MNERRPRVTCIIGGQYGSEGKGKVCGYLANDFDIAVRVGAPNAGHTLQMGKNKWKMQQIPVAGLVNRQIMLCIGAAGLLNLKILKREMEWVPECDSRILIDRNAGILEPHHQEQEEKEKMFEGIGSTCEGVGAALRDKIRRDKGFRTAKDVQELKGLTGNVAHYINNTDARVMIEGTQGYALSLNHGPYPYCTSRDIIASSLLSDVGLAPSTCNDVLMVIRTYPIRVAGNSGPMCGKELRWSTVTKRAGYPKEIVEKTTVTKRVRRVCEFDIGLIREAVAANRPNSLALMFMDYIDYADFGKTRFQDLTDKSKKFVHRLEDKIKIPIPLLGTGPDFTHMIDRRTDSGIFDEGNYA